MIFNRRGSIKFFRPEGRGISTESTAAECLPAIYIPGQIPFRGCQVFKRTNITEVAREFNTFRVTSITRENLFSSFLSLSLSLSLSLTHTHTHTLSGVLGLAALRARFTKGESSARREPARGPLILGIRCRQTGTPLVNAATAL